MSDSQLIPCKSCGATNRIPPDKLREGSVRPVCGRCKAPLESKAGPLVVTDASFAAVVEKSSTPVLVDMWAPWCGPCRIIAPVVDELAQEMAGRVRVTKLNVDENPMTSERFQVRSIPALLIFREGREIDRIVGAQPKAEIRRRLERLL